MIIDIGETTIRMNRVDYIEKIYDSDSGDYGIRITFKTGAHQSVWFKFYGNRDKAYYRLFANMK